MINNKVALGVILASSLILMVGVVFSLSTSSYFRNFGEKVEKKKLHNATSQQFTQNVGRLTYPLESQINRPSKNEVSSALVQGSVKLPNVGIPFQDIVDFIYPIFYPPNGNIYDLIQATLSEEYDCNNETCRNMWHERDLRNGYKVIFVHLIGQYKGFQDKYVIGLTYSPVPSKNEKPSVIALNGSPESIAPLLAHSLDTDLSKNKTVQKFMNRYRVTKGNYTFYRAGLSSVDPSNPLINMIRSADLSISQDWIIARFEEDGVGIPETPRESLTVYINPKTRQIFELVY